jgi:2-C-methyl-D-erythritol 2,4-cyclodiphosphate synthase
MKVLRQRALRQSPDILPPMDSASTLRIGHGYDLHRLEPLAPEGPGRPFILAGARFDHDRGPVGHSDGDAVYHAVTDALLGAIGLPDIGQLFPDDDPRWEGADSALFLREANVRLRQQGWRILNLDITVICEQPKLGPRKQEMIANVAGTLGLEPRQVNLKGKTHERVDAVGEGRAIEVHAVALVQGSGPAPQRDYTTMAAELERRGAAGLPREGRMAMTVEVLWKGLARSGVSWLGFYLDQPGEPDDQRLLLGPREPGPACSPIGLHGVCGQALRSGEPRIIRDVAELGSNYIACDPRDRSEIVLPLRDAGAPCWGVLDLDSHSVGAFDAGDAGGLSLVLRAAGLLR